MNLAPASKIAITLLVDNFTDRIIAESPHAARAPLGKDGRILPAPVAEHGFSALVEIDLKTSGAPERKTFLFDTGTSASGVIHNIDLFGIDLKRVDGVILSHGHFDHFLGLENVAKRIGRPFKLYVHPDAFLKRYFIFPDGTKLAQPVLDELALSRQGAEVIKSERPTWLPEGRDPVLALTGEIPRETSYEIGFPTQYAEVEGKGLVHDPLVKDDQALVANIEGKGLVVISGCGHAGIINTVNYAKKLTGVDEVHAVVGGFHLSGRLYEAAIEPTIHALEDTDPDFLVPCHCTGWKAVNTIIQRMPAKFIQPTVGAKFEF